MLPALAIAEALVDAGHEPSAIHYVGAGGASRPGCCRRRRSRTRSSTSSACSASSTWPTSGATRRWCPKLVRGARRPCALLRELRPQVVVSVGGYASLPAVLAARRLGIPIVVVSYDRRPGPGQRADGPLRGGRRAVAFPDSPLPRAVVTGAPVRRPLLAVDRGRRPRPAPRRRSACPPTASSSPSPAARRARRRSTTPSPRTSPRHADDARPRRPPGRRRALPRRAPAPRDGRDGRPPPGRRLRGPHRAALRRRRPARRPWRGQHGRRGRRHRHAGGPRAVVRAPPRTTRRSTCAGSPTRAAAVLLAEADVGRLGEVIDGCAPTRRGSPRSARRARTAGDAAPRRQRSSSSSSARAPVAGRTVARTLLAWSSP